MMKDREFRELQVSSTQLAIIFLGILVLGVIIFLLGVSVGKKHAQEAEKASLVAQKEPEVVKDKIVLPEARPAGIEQTKVPAKEELQAKKEAPPEKLKAEPRTEAPVQVRAPARKENLYYVQVGALTDRQAALAAAEQFKSQGYGVIVLDPLPTDRVPYFRVRVGGFATKADAEAVKNKLSLASGKKTDFFIVRD